MKQHKKVTYTLTKDVIDLIEMKSIRFDLPKSKWVSNCIISGFDKMVDDYYENDKQPLVGVNSKRSNTTPKTFTLPIDVIQSLNWFSEKLGVKKSHLVSASVLSYIDIETQQFLDEVEEFKQYVISLKQS